MAIGIDIVETERIRRILKRHGDKFLDRILSEEEKDYVTKKRRIVESLSGIFAAKEAFIKALGRSVPLKKIRIVHNQGRPLILYENELYRSLSISHEKNYAIAVVLLQSGGNNR